jgi:hypothetical protein
VEDGYFLGTTSATGTHQLLDSWFLEDWVAERKNSHYIMKNAKQKPKIVCMAFDSYHSQAVAYYYTSLLNSIELVWG